MRILLDESLPKALLTRLAGHEAATVVSCGWSGVKNGKLLALAATRFDVFLTADQNLEFQQNLSTLPIAVLVLVVGNNRIESIDLARLDVGDVHVHAAVAAWPARGPARSGTGGG
ncbi:MAG: DUF5615 family PIN-like protein [Burkholderiales bacterium]|jgi:hypothetical protein|nr:DUF5615 family PIN-like protein [Burkholderiales bacterium]